MGVCLFLFERKDEVYLKDMLYRINICLNFEHEWYTNLCTYDIKVMVLSTIHHLKVLRICQLIHSCWKHTISILLLNWILFIFTQCLDLLALFHCVIHIIITYEYVYNCMCDFLFYCLALMTFVTMDFINMLLLLIIIIDLLFLLLLSSLLFSN